MFNVINRFIQRINYIHWLIQKAINKRGTKTFKLSNSVEIDYPLNSAVGKQLFFGKFEVGEMDFFKSVLKPGNTVLDIGANAGIYSLIASRIVGPTGHIYAFEIGPNEIKMFQNNVAKNNAKNITLLEYAVSNKTGQAEFALSQDGAMNSLAKNDHPEQIISKWLTVNTITLNDAVKEYDIKHIDVIKIDVEGAEKLVFEGGLETMFRWMPKYILFEASNLTSQAFGYDVLTFIKYLKNNNFLVYVLNGSSLVIFNSNDQYHLEQYNFVAIPNELK